MQPRFMRPAGPDDVREFARLVDSDLVRRVVADVHVSLDEPDDTLTRAAAVREVLPHRLLAAGVTVHGPDAAWLHSGGDGPDTVHVALPSGRGRAGAPYVVVHEARLGPGDVTVVEGVRVTSPERTAADVARCLPPAAALPALDRLAATVPLEPRDVLVALERLSGCRGVEAARQTLQGWADSRRPVLAGHPR